MADDVVDPLGSLPSYHAHQCATQAIPHCLEAASLL